MSISRKDISILGGGLTGLLLARLLARRGFRPTVYERDGDPRLHPGQEGRSINLALAERGRRALKRADMLDEVMACTTPMPGRQIHALDGTLTFQPYGQRDWERIYSVARADLNVALMNACDQSGVTLKFNQRCIDVDTQARVAIVEHAISGKQSRVKMDPLIAADGAGSIVRRRLNDTAGFGSDERLLDHGYKELSIPPTAYGAYRMNPHALHIWPRGGFMLIALPNPGGDFTATLFLPNKGENGFESVRDKQQAMQFFSKNFPDALTLMPGLSEEYESNPVGIMGTIRCKRWHMDGDVLLIGDAAHAIVPFHGQGMNAAFEDCYKFDRLLGANPDSWQALFADFQREQRENTDAIADMALENYVEMRDSVRDPAFHLRKKLAFELERHAENHFVPRYSMVMFHPEIDYRIAKQRGAVQAELLAEFCDGLTHFEQVDLDAALTAVKQRLTPLEVPHAAVDIAANWR